jgi:hypothetical protein
MNESRKVRHRFYKALFSELKVVWPVFSALVGIIVSMGLTISYLEEWRPFEGIYFSFITGLTVGYGDFVPKRTISRVIAIAISFTGILLTALFAAISVRALQVAVNDKSQPDA